MRKYVLVGASVRSLGMFARPLQNQFAGTGEVVGLMDTNARRAEKIKSLAALKCKVYSDFDAMIRDCRPTYTGPVK